MISKQLQVFIGIRLIFALTILFLLPLYDSRTFVFIDLDLYSGIAGRGIPFWELPNPLFSALTRILNYTPELFKSWYFIALSLFVNIFTCSIFVYISTKIHSIRASFLYSILLGAHPYLALYSLKLDTSLFAILPIGLICTGVLLGKWKKWIIICTGILSLFRNSLLPVGWIVVLKNIRRLKSFLQTLGLIILSTSTLLQFSYAVNYVGQSYGCYSMSNVSSWLRNYDIGIRLSEILAFVLTPFIHLALDLGARESIALNCLSLPREVAGISWIHFSSTICFFIFHTWLLWRLVKFIYSQYKIDKIAIELYFPLVILLPTLYGAAHMRYLIPLLPMLLLFLFKLESVRELKSN